MERQLSIHSSEWKVMECIWGHEPVSIMQVVKFLQEESEWSKSTIITMINRLRKKGIIDYKEEKRSKVLYTLVSREEIALSETDTLLEKVFHGSISLMLNTLLKEQSITEEEREELIDILDRAERKQL